MAILPAQATKHLEELSLEELMQIRVVGVSKYEQSQKQVAAAVSVITRNDIKTYGWRTLVKLASLPGVHTTYDRQYIFLHPRLWLPGDFNTEYSSPSTAIASMTLPTIKARWLEFPLDLDLIERIGYPWPRQRCLRANAMLASSIS